MLNRDNQGSALARRPQEGLSRRRDNDWLWQRDPWREMQDMQRRMDQLISSAFGGGWPGAMAPMGQVMNQIADMGVAEPDIDISENESEFTIRAALPGIQPNDIDIQATEESIRLVARTRTSDQPQQQEKTDGSNGQPGNTVTGQGQSTIQQAGSQSTTQHRQGQFTRVSRFEFAYTLPEEIRANDVRADFRNGVLELHLPKAQPNASRNRVVNIPISATGQTQQISGGGQTQQGTQMPSDVQAMQGGQASAGAGARAGGSQHQAGARTGVNAGANEGAGQANQTKPGSAAKAK